MTEQKLHQAAAALPMPNCSFEMIVKKANTQRSPAPSPRRFYRLCAICAALFILAGCTTWAATTAVDYGAWASHSSSFQDVKLKANKLDILLPEVLDGNPFHSVSTSFVAPHGTTYLEALIRPAYRFYSVAYTGPESGTEHAFTVSFGSTENGLWQYCFQFGQDNLWCPDDLVPGTYQAVEYNGRLLQLGTTSSYWEYTGETTYSNHIHWVEEDRNICLALSSDADLDTLVEYAMQIIDMNL